VSRRYCWRTGLVIEIPDGERCPECGHDHRPLVDQSLCGRFVPFWESVPTPDGGGEPCVLPAGHDGPCRGETLRPDPEDFLSRLPDELSSVGRLGGELRVRLLWADAQIRVARVYVAGPGSDDWTPVGMALSRDVHALSGMLGRIGLHLVDPRWVDPRDLL